VPLLRDSLIVASVGYFRGSENPDTLTSPMPPGLNRIRIWIPLLLLASFSGLAQIPAPPYPGKLIDLGGRRLHLNCSGKGSPTVLVENGGGSFSMEWTLVQQIVSKDTRICTYDRAGYAWSDHGPMDESIEQVMDDLHLLLRKAAIPTPLIVVCQSLGCIYARAYQRRYPEQIAGLIFVDGTHDEGVTLVQAGERKPISLITREQLPRKWPTIPPHQQAGGDPGLSTMRPSRRWGTRWWWYGQMWATQPDRTTPQELLRSSTGPPAIS
jgi:pimeloyl-ACP methyl ester carboxylesterase